MRNSRSSVVVAFASTVLTATFAGAAYTAGLQTAAAPPPVVVPQTFVNAAGEFTNINANPAGGPANPFNQALGTNGRACVTCHQPGYGWSVTPYNVQSRFTATNGTDPIFNTVDGSNSPNDNVSTVADRQEAYSMLLTKGLFRIGIGIPANAEFKLVAVDDPYGFASSAQLSLFRRPLPSTNLRFLTAVMSDGRETIAGQTITQDLASQASNAVTTHEQGTAPSATVLANIVAFEQGLTTAQSLDNDAGSLTADGATGGPAALAAQNFYVGINDSAGGNPTGAAFNPNAMTLYTSWAATTSAAAALLSHHRPMIRLADLEGAAPISMFHLADMSAPVSNSLFHLAAQPGRPAPPPPPAGPPSGVGAPPPPPVGPPAPPPAPAPPTSPTAPTSPPVSSSTAAQQSIARGEAIFNGHTFAISGVGGLNDVAGTPVITGTCTSCHDTPNVGNHSVETFLNIGTSAGALRTSDLPLYTLQNNTTGALIQTTDPGRALITGKWADIGKFKVPTLRALPTRPPYFHNGMAADAAAVVAFYNTRFNIGLSGQQQADLAAFLRTL